MLRVRLLGDLVTERDGVPVTPSGAPRRLLAFLALRPGPHGRDALAARFWPDTPPAAARASLRTAVWALRRDVGADVVPASRTGVGLDPLRLWVDVAEVRSLAARGDVESAVALCRGELLAGWTDDWVESARAEHRECYLGLLDRLAARADDAGDALGAVRWSRMRCAAAPLDEPAHCALMARVAATGDRAGALLVGRELAGRLRTELGVTPGPATRAATARIRGPSAAGGVPATRRPLFGRADELRTLIRAWTEARAGHGGLVVVTGEGGIGKTRLTAELASRAENAGARVAVGAGLDVGGEAPLAVWQELARELVRVVAPPPDGASWPSELGRLAPDLATALGRSEVPAPVASPELERTRVYDAVLRLVEWAAAGRPVLLVAEDVHRSDRASMALCTHIGRRVAGLPLLFVLTRRDRPARPEPDALIADLAGRGVEVAEIDLGPMTDDELAAVALSVAPLDDADVTRAVRAAEGNPLLVVESARALAAGRTAPPASLRAAVRASLGSLTPAARELVETIAVAGREMVPSEVGALGPAGAPDVDEEVLETGLLRRTRTGLGFRHALLAEATRAELTDPSRRHERAGLAIEAAAGPRGDPVAAEVARHLTAAGRDDLAAARWCRAARHARAMGALPEAAGFWTEAVRCDPDAAPPRLELAEVLGWLGRTDDFEREWWAALERFPDHDRAVAWSRRGTLLRTVVCYPAASLEAYRTAWELLAADAPASLRVEVLVGRAWAEASAGDASRTDPLLAEVTALVQEPDATTTAQIENVRLMAVIRLGRFADCAAVAERGGAAALRARRPDLAYPIWLNAASALGVVGEFDRALWAAEQGVAATRGIAVLEQPSLAGLAFLLSRVGRHDEALAAAAEQLAMADRAATAEHLALARHDTGLVALAAGRHREAAGHLGVALEGQARIGRPAARLARAEALALDGDPDGAAAELRRAVQEEVGPEDQPWALVPRIARVQGLVARAGGDRDEAVRRFHEAAAAWSRLRGPDPSTEFLTNFVDLGRPPVVGLLEPDREIARLEREIAAVGGDREVT